VAEADGDEAAPVDEGTVTRVELSGTTMELEAAVKEVAGVEEELEEAGQRSAVPSILLTTHEEASSV
jgi:hypothetical protein